MLGIKLNEKVGDIIKYDDKISLFGFESILNINNEKIIIIIGGFNHAQNDGSFSLILYNFDKNELYVKLNVCPSILSIFVVMIYNVL